MNEITRTEPGVVTATTKPFVHLKVHSAYSLLEGALTITKLVALARADRMPALALTDTNNLFGALEFSAGLAEAGIQPIIGCTLSLSFANNDSPTETRGPRSEGRIALLAKDAEGYANLMWLSTEAYQTASVTGEAVASLSSLKAHAAGLIALTGGPDGVIDQALAAGNPDLARARLTALHTLFGDRLYVELQRHGLPQERAVEPLLLDLAYAASLPVVATNEAYFASADDFEAHDALICIAEGSYVTVDQRRRLSPEHSFKTQREMVQAFADLPEAIENTLEIAQRCAYRPVERAPILPQFVAGGSVTSEQGAAEAKELRRQSEAGLAERLAIAGVAPGFEAKDYTERLAYELDVITRMNYQGYFLIVADFIKWA